MTMSTTDTFVTYQVESNEDDHPYLLDSSVIVAVKPCVWISVSDHRVALVHGYNVASMNPPVLFLASDVIPADMLLQMKQHDIANSSEKMRVTLSSATVREQSNISKASAPTSSTPFADLGLVPHTREGYPPAVSSSPIHMFCHVLQLVDLEQSITSGAKGKGGTMILLQIDAITMRNDILTVPPPSPSSSRQILALVDAIKLAPLVSLGKGRYVVLDRLYSLMRPSETEIGTWISDDLQLKHASAPENVDKESCARDDDKGDLPELIEWITSEPSPLGFDPIKAIVIPRPIGWISTYHNEIAHVAPYSFFMDVCHADDAENSYPIVAFAAYRPSVLKDVHLDIHDSKCFGVSTVTPELAVAMNLSSAPIPREESEFELAGLQVVPGQCIRAPLVEGSPLTMECEYVKTVDVGCFSILIGKVVAVRVSKAVLSVTGQVDSTKLRSVTRLGYEDEYAIIDKSIHGATLPAVESMAVGSRAV